MLPSASALACRREERVQKAFSVDHHGPGNARLSHRAIGVYGAKCDYVMRIPTVEANVGNISALHSIVFRPGLSTRVLCAQDRDMSGGGCSRWTWPLKDIGWRLRSSSDGMKTYSDQNGRGELGYTEFQIDGGWSGVVTCLTPWRPLLATAPRRGTAEAARRLPAPVRSIGRPGAAPEPGRGQLVRTVWMSS